MKAKLEELLAKLASAEATSTSELGTYISVSSTNYTTPCDGYFFLGTGNASGNLAYGYVNENLFLMAINFTGYAYPCQTLFVKKGMRLRASGTYDARFYPML